MPDDIQALLQKPLNELALDKEQSEGIQITGADALMPKETPADMGSAPTSDDDSKVPYRRFKKFHDRALEAEQEAEYWKNKALESRTAQEPNYQNYYQPPAPNQNVEPVFQGADWQRFQALFAGADENAVKDAYRLEVQRTAAIEERAVQRASDAFEQRSQNQRQEVRANREFLDTWTDDVSDLVGRDLSDDEQVALLDIMDEFSPKNRDGIIEAPLDPSQALRIFQMQNSGHSQRREARNAVASMSSVSSGGDTSVAQKPQENNQQFNAQLGWRANFRRLTGRDPDSA